MSSEAQNLKKQLADANRQLSELRKENQALVVRAEILPLAYASGVHISAIEDVLLRAEQSFDVGANRVLIGKNGETPERWLADSRVKNAQWWPEGESAGEKTPTLPKVNPWLPGSFNLTEQGRIVRDNPKQAAALARAAGVALPM